MPQQALFVGVDVSKDRLDVFVHPTGARLDCANDAEGRRRLLKRLGELPGLQAVCLEATGGYERPLLNALAEAGSPARLVSPDEVRAFARATRRRAKSDPLDAALIARFAAAVEGRPHQRHPSRERLAEHVGFRRHLVDLVTALESRAEKIEDRALRRAADAAGATLRARIKRIEGTIARLLAADPELARLDALLRSIPGVGVILSATLIARMPELGALTDKQAAALVGVAPYDRQSGGQERARAIRGGRRDLRRALYMPALVAARANPDFTRFRDRLRDRGKPGKVIIVALMNKLIRLANTVVGRGAPWSPAP